MSPRFLLPSRADRSLFAAVVALGMIGPMAVAGADDHLPAASDVTTMSGVETGALIAGVLGELGLDTDDVVTLTGDVRQAVNDRVDAMIDGGVVTPEQVESLEALVARGGFDEQVPARVTESRARRDAFRSAALGALADLGIAVPDGASLKDVLDANGIDPAEFAEIPDDAVTDLAPPPRHPPPPSDFPHEDPVGPSHGDQPSPTIEPDDLPPLPPVDDGTDGASPLPPPPDLDPEAPNEPPPLPPYPESGDPLADGPVLDSGPRSVLGSNDETPPLSDADQPPTL